MARSDFERLLREREYKKRKAEADRLRALEDAALLQKAKEEAEAADQQKRRRRAQEDELERQHRIEATAANAVKEDRLAQAETAKEEVRGLMQCERSRARPRQKHQNTTDVPLPELAVGTGDAGAAEEKVIVANSRDHVEEKEVVEEVKVLTKKEKRTLKNKQKEFLKQLKKVQGNPKLRKCNRHLAKLLNERLPGPIANNSIDRPVSTGSGRKLVPKPRDAGSELPTLTPTKPSMLKRQGRRMVGVYSALYDRPSSALPVVSTSLKGTPENSERISVDSYAKLWEMHQQRDVSVFYCPPSHTDSMEWSRPADAVSVNLGSRPTSKTLRSRPVSSGIESDFSNRPKISVTHRPSVPGSGLPPPSDSVRKQISPWVNQFPFTTGTPGPEAGALKPISPPTTFNSNQKPYPILPVF